MFEGPSSLEVGPCWCAQRFGQTATTLPDGTVIRIGGEHEDYYDPDFTIYNDVIVVAPGGELRIFGYPLDVFAPTDFHTATLAGDGIAIIGSLGYAGARTPGVTPVYLLDLATRAITRAPSTGAAPGWIHQHTAELSGRTIVVRGGLVAIEGLRENIDSWAYDLDSGVWTRLTELRWQQWEIERADERTNHLFELDSIAFYSSGDSDFHRTGLADALEHYGAEPDLATFHARYTPPVPHAAVAPVPDEHGVTRIVIDGVTVRYVEDTRTVRIVFEGELPEPTIERVVGDLWTKLAALERAECTRRRLT